MSSKGFDADDISSTMARFSHRHIDESKLKLKTLETGALSSATHDAGAVVLSVVVDALIPSQTTTKESDLGYGYKDGHQGFGFYAGDIKMDD